MPTVALPIAANTCARRIVVASDDDRPVHVDGETRATAAHRRRVSV